jgi:hypothetical protein
MDPNADLQAANDIRCMNAPDKMALAVYYLGLLAEGGGTGSSSSNGYAGAAALRTEAIHDGGTRPSVAILVFAATAGDGGQGIFWWDSSETGADDGLNVIRASDVPFPTAGAWVRLS